MNVLYCDSSALVKLYVVEAHTDALRAWLGRSDAVAVSRIAWAEAHAALSRRTRESAADVTVIAEAKQALADDWPHYLIMEVTQAVVARAGDYADVFALRGYDSVQLASAFELQRLSGIPVSFTCFDARLNAAARILGLSVPFGPAG